MSVPVQVMWHNSNTLLQGQLLIEMIIQHNAEQFSLVFCRVQ